MAQVDPELHVKCYSEYMMYSLDKAIPTKKQFMKNLEVKRNDSEFWGDTVALLRPDENYNQEEAFE